jgi:hypothetical protein
MLSHFILMSPSLHTTWALHCYALQSRIDFFSLFLCSHMFPISHHYLWQCQLNLNYINIMDMHMLICVLISMLMGREK